MTYIDPSKRTDFPTAFDERATLTQLLSYVRLTVHAKCVGLSQSDAVQTRSPTERPTTLCDRRRDQTIISRLPS